MKLTITRLLFGCLFVIMSLTAQAQTCNPNIQKTKPDRQYELLNNDTEVLDKKTGLIWQRCALGMSWNGSTCSGTATSHTWEDALAQAATAATNTGVAWRVPNAKELLSLYEPACDPGINEALFPSSPYYVRSSTAPIFDWQGWTDYAINGALGNDVDGNKDVGLAVRLVRSQ
jgi:hypothetical protein